MSAEEFQIKIKDPKNKMTTVNVSNNMKIKEVIKLYNLKNSDNVNDANFLFFRTKRLDNNSTIKQCKIQPGATISLLNAQKNLIKGAKYF